MKLWVVLTTVLVARSALAQCPVVVLADPTAPSAERPTIIRLQDWRQHPSGPTPVVISIGKDSIVVEQAMHIVPALPGRPILPWSVPPPIDLGLLAPGRYDVVWRYRDPNSSVIFDTFARSFHVNEPTIATLTPSSL